MPPRLLTDVINAPGYADAVARAMAPLRDAVDEGEAACVLSDAAVCLGAEAAAFGSFLKDDDSHQSFRFLLACDLAWCAEYERHAWYGDDPWLEFARRHTEPRRSAEIPVLPGTQQAVARLAQKHGFRDAFITPAPSSGDVKRMGVLCLGADRDDYFNSPDLFPLINQCRWVAMAFNAWWIDRMKLELRDSARLTAEDVLLLKAEYEGHGTKSISVALQQTEHAINSRFQRINARLGVPNRRVAAQLAAEYGLLFE